MTTIYLVRHCEAMGNINRIFQGHTDEEISENGRMQLERLAERFRGIHLDAVYSSPLKRAYHTAEAVNRYHRLPIHTDGRLMEINGGHWEEKPWEALPELYPSEWEDWSERPWRFEAEGGEPMREVYRRMAEALTDIAAAHPGGSGWRPPLTAAPSATPFAGLPAGLSKGCWRFPGVTIPP